LINHYKFFGKDTNLEIPWPHGIGGKDPILGLFHFEADSEYSFMTSNKDIMDKFDFTAIPRADADLPITLICNWGFPVSKYLDISPFKVTETQTSRQLPGSPVYVADFRGTIPDGYAEFFKQLHENLNIDFYAGPYKNAEPPQPYILSERISHMGEYMFVIVAESIVEDDWVCPEFSQTLLSGAVPIYFGAPNIDKYLPGDGAIVNGKDFSSADQLINYIIETASDADLYYQRHLKWKSNPIRPSFKQHLDNCAHLAECRICKKVLEIMTDE